jgi:hypothetical protein
MAAETKDMTSKPEGYKKNCILKKIQKQQTNGAEQDSDT